LISSFTTRTTRPFELIHFDLWISPVLSIFGFKYFLVIIDCSTHWWCGVDVGVLYITTQLETPREGYDEHSSKSSLSCETKVYRTSRRKNQTSKG
jgi:hypothetical protein